MDRRCFRDERGHYVFAAGAAPNGCERTEAQRAIDAIRSDLADVVSGSNPAIGMVVMKIHVAMNRPIAGPEATAIAEVWTDGLEGVPVAAIKEAYRRFTQGTSDLPRNYMPKVPEFAGLARDIAMGWSCAARRLELLLARQEARPEEVPSLSPAGVAALADWRKKMAALR